MQRPTPPASSDGAGLLLGLIGVVIFGLTLPATRVAVAELDPYFVGLGRGVLAAALAGLLLMASGQRWPPREACRPLR